MCSLHRSCYIIILCGESVREKKGERHEVKVRINALAGVVERVRHERKSA